MQHFYYLVITLISVVHIHARFGITVVPWVVLCMHGIHTAYVHDLESRMALLQKSTSTVKQNQGTELYLFSLSDFLFYVYPWLVIFDKGYLNSEGEILTKA